MRLSGWVGLATLLLLTACGGGGGGGSHGSVGSADPPLDPGSGMQASDPGGAGASGAFTVSVVNQGQIGLGSVISAMGGGSGTGTSTSTSPHH